jgi:hypothetical protein
MKRERGEASQEDEEGEGEDEDEDEDEEEDGGREGEAARSHCQQEAQVSVVCCLTR